MLHDIDYVKFARTSKVIYLGGVGYHDGLYYKSRWCEISLNDCKSSTNITNIKWLAKITDKDVIRLDWLNFKHIIYKFYF